MLSASNAEMIDADNVKTGKSQLHLIPDFVIKPNCSSREREHNLGRGLVIRDGKNRLKPEDVTEAQWAGASFRIFAEMVDGMDIDEIKQYIHYISTVVIMNQFAMIHF